MNTSTADFDAARGITLSVILGAAAWLVLGLVVVAVWRGLG